MTYATPKKNIMEITEKNRETEREKYSVKNM